MWWVDACIFHRQLSICAAFPKAIRATTTTTTSNSKREKKNGRLFKFKTPSKYTPVLLEYIFESKIWIIPFFLNDDDDPLEKIASL